MDRAAGHLERVEQVELGDEARSRMLSLLEAAKEAGLPTEPLVAKLLEGVAKGVQEARVLAAVRAVHSRQQRAKDILEHSLELGALGPVTGSDIARTAAGISSGVPPEQIGLLSRAAAEAEAPVSRIVAAVGTLERLRAMGVYDDAAAHVLASALAEDRSEADLRRLAEDYRRHAMGAGDAAPFFDALPGGWGAEGLSETDLPRDAADRIDSGLLPGEAGAGGESAVPGKDRLGRDDGGDDDPYARDRGDPRDDYVADHPGGDQPHDEDSQPDHP